MADRLVVACLVDFPSQLLHLAAHMFYPPFYMFRLGFAVSIACSSTHSAASHIPPHCPPACSSITENTRAAYPISFISNARVPCMGPHPRNIIMLCCDAFGVLPPVSRLSMEQAVYYFMRWGEHGAGAFFFFFLSCMWGFLLYFLCGGQVECLLSGVSRTHAAFRNAWVGHDISYSPFMRCDVMVDIPHCKASLLLLPLLLLQRLHCQGQGHRVWGHRAACDLLSLLWRCLPGRPHAAGGAHVACHNRCIAGRRFLEVKRLLCFHAPDATRAGLSQLLA